MVILELYLPYFLGYHALVVLEPSKIISSLLQNTQTSVHVSSLKQYCILFISSTLYLCFIKEQGRYSSGHRHIPLPSRAGHVTITTTNTSRLLKQ